MGFSSRIPRIPDPDESSERTALVASGRFAVAEDEGKPDVGGRVPTAHESARLAAVVSASSRLPMMDLLEPGEAQGGIDVSDIPETFKTDMNELAGYELSAEELRELWDNDPMKGEMLEEPEEKYLAETPWDVFMEAAKEREKKDGTAERRHEKQLEAWTTGFVDNESQHGEDDDAADAEANAEHIVHWSDSAKNGYDDDIEGTSGNLQCA